MLFFCLYNAEEDSASCSDSDVSCVLSQAASRSLCPQTLHYCLKHFNIFASNTSEALQNCHGRTMVDFLIDYWIVSKSICKLSPEVRQKMLYLVLNSMSEYNHLLIKQVLNPMFSCVLI